MNLHKSTISTILIAFSIISLAQEKENSQTMRLFYLGGQSNMDGYGYNRDLPEELNKPFKDVWIFHGNTSADDDDNGGMGIWETLKPGHGVGSASDGTKNELSDRFGVELSFAKRIQELYPGDKIAIIKYSKGGTSIDTMASNFDTWEPNYVGKNGINQYDHFLSTVRNAMSQPDIDGDGIPDKLIPAGIIWMQGESDGEGNEGAAGRYYENLKRLMDLIRAALHSDDLPVVIGKISDSMMENGKTWDYGELIQHAQEKYASIDGRASIVRSTQKYGYSDPWHYNSEGYIDLGSQFAEALQRLIEE